MDLITLTLTKNHLWSAASILGLAGITYLSNRYVKNTVLTTNQTYFKPIEVQMQNQVQMQQQMNQFHNHKPITYLFWNGDMASTYLLIDLLLQDNIIQPLYVERYTIIKELEKDKLELLVSKNVSSNTNTTITNTNILKDSKGNYKNKNTSEFLKNISILKKSQDYELTQLNVLRMMILAQYPEFKNNLLPTTYITTIAKDLEYTSRFYNALRDIKPIHCDGIDFIEQIVRFLKHYYKLKDSGSSSRTISRPRIIIGCTKDYKNIKLLIQLIKLNIIPYNSNKTKYTTGLDSIGGIGGLDSMQFALDIPILDMDNKTVKFMSVEFFPNDIMQYFLKKEVKN